MFNKSIAYRLSIYLSLAVISVFIAFIIITFFFNSKTVNESIQNEANRNSSIVTAVIEKQLITTKEITSNVSEQILFYAHHDDTELFIARLMEKYKSLNAIRIRIDSAVPNVNYHNFFIFNGPDSTILERGNEKIFHCEVEKRIYEKVIAEGVPAWTEIFNCSRNNKMVVSYYSPIQVTDEFGKQSIAGSVICELSLSNLNDTINRIGFGKDGYAMVVSNDGTYITHPNKDWVFNRNLLTTSAKQYDSKRINIGEKLKNGEDGYDIVYPEYLNYEKSRIYYSVIKETGWAILFIIPYDELYAPFYLLMLRMLFIAVIGVLMIFFIVTFIANKLIQPLSVVTTKLKKFSNLTGEFELNTLNEITMVSDSLNYLQNWYEKFKVSQNQEEKLNQQRRIDLLEASEIQMSLINMNFSSLNNLKTIDLFATYKPAKIVSGDLFDYFLIDDENLFFSIGDVSGKGISAAFFMSVAQTIIKSKANSGDPGNIVFNVNNELYTTNQHQFFLTLFVGILNLKTGLLKYCNAAHTSSIILSKTGKITELGQNHGVPLGIYENKEYMDSSLTVNKGDLILLYTDGVSDQRNEENDHFGADKLKQILRRNSKLSPQALINKIENELDNFRGKNKQTDDITILSLKI